jgi:PhoPQ-activated pathogenicity-related protein
MVDPFEYRGNIKVPTMIVNGANDAYWAADATSIYWKELKQPKWLVTMPNAGHSLGNKVQAVEAVSAMARAIAKGKTLPVNPSGTYDPRKDAYTVRFEPKDLVGLKFWTAVSVNTDFRQRVYRARPTMLEPGASSATFEPRKDLMPSENVAVFAEVRYRIDGKEFSINTPTVVAKATTQ